VWHADEVTYSVALRTDLLPKDSTSVNGSYAWVSQGWLEGLRQLGVQAGLAPGGVRTNGANCFAASAGCDFVVDGRKLIGAAQCRAEGAILQHGSLLLSVNESHWRRAAGGSMSGAVSLMDLGVEPSWDQVVEALAAGFSLVHDAQLRLGRLSEAELNLANRLHLYKYSSPLWTFEAKSDLSPEQVSNT
jgi:lipoate-protein ligase A